MSLKAELTKLLLATLSTDFNIKKCEFSDEEVKGGYVSQITNVKVVVEKDGIEKMLDLVVKSGDKSCTSYTDVYIIEFDVYSNILTHFNAFAKERGVDNFENIPECYGVSKSDNLVVVILENLLSKGYRLHELSPLDLDHTKILLNAYANWHALSFAMNDQEPHIFKRLGKRQTKLNEFKFYESIVSSLEEQMDYIIEIYKEQGESQVLNKLTSLRKNYRNLMGEAMMNENENYLVVTHSDTWNNNFLFKYDKEDKPIGVKIVDWQTAIVGSPMMDIAQLLFFCCSRKELEHIDELLFFYHSALSKRIGELGSDPNKCFPFDNCQKSFRRYAPLGIGGMPFLMRMFYSSSDPNEIKNTSEGNFSAVFEESVTNNGKYFEEVNSVLELCISRDLI